MHARFFITACLIIILFWNTAHAVAPVPLKAGEEVPVKKKVLLLNSYHKGYLWTDEITRGVQEAFSDQAVDLHIEYMDTKRQFKSELFHLQAILLRLKHKQHKYDIIVSSDDNAFNFLTARKPHIFGDLPVVFCGVNYLQKETVTGLNDYTGINEKMDIKENIELIKTLHPNLKKIVVITDNTTTGKRNQKETRRIAALPENMRFKIDLIYDVDINDLISAAAEFKKGTIALFTVFFRDKNDHFFEYETVLEQVSAKVKVPLYATQNFNKKIAVVGGLLTNGYDQGTAAAQKAKAILSGTPVPQVPIMWKTPTHPRFNYQLLKKHGIDIARLPEGSQILFKPVSFYEQNKLIIGVAACAFFLLLLAFLGVSYGFIQSKKAQKRVSESEKRYRHLFDNAPVGMYEFDITQRRFTNVNDILCKMSGYSKQELLTMDLYDLLAEESRPVYLERIKKITTEDKNIPKSVEYNIIRKDSQKRFAVFNFDFIYFDGILSQIQVVVQDITERKQVEELMIQTEKMLSVGGLAAGMAHEINNPLAGMMQNAQVIYNRLSKPLPANQTAAEEIGISIENIQAYMEKRSIFNLIDSINEAGARAAKIINNMLSFSKKSDSTQKEHDLSQLIEQTLELARSDYNLAKKFDFKKIKIKRSYPPEMPRVFCEKTKIEQVLLNLFKNASEAMASNPDKTRLPTLELRLFKDSKFACIEIKDNGPGMDHETRKRIFEPFFTTKSVDQGTGLGLSVSYFIIVDDHKGEMAVESSLGKGTRFIIRLPLSKV